MQKKINFVTESESETWILRRWCEEWAKHIPNSTITAFKSDESADVNVYVNYNLFNPTSKTKSICVFTHREHDEKALIFDAVAIKCDWCLAQCINTLDLLPPTKSSIVKVGIGSHFYRDKPYRIGISGRYYPTGRKRWEWVREIESTEGIEIVWTDGQIDYKDMPKFYDSIDAVLVTSDDREGGPMCIVEALARGKTVISTNTGWAWEYPVIRYDDISQLKELVKRLVIPKDLWKEGAKEIETIANII